MNKIKKMKTTRVAAKTKAKLLEDLEIKQTVVTAAVAAKQNRKAAIDSLLVVRS